jgi:hypothetical protein
MIKNVFSAYIEKLVHLKGEKTQNFQHGYCIQCRLVSRQSVCLSACLSCYLESSVFCTKDLSSSTEFVNWVYQMKMLLYDSAFSCDCCCFCCCRRSVAQTFLYVSKLTKKKNSTNFFHSANSE